VPDVGLQVINDLARSLITDRRWLHTVERGFRWWPGPLAQTCWSEPCFEDQGLAIARVHVRTDFLTAIPLQPAQLAQLGLLMRHAGMSGLLHDPERPGRFQLAASVYVHEQTRPWLTQVLRLVAACQTAEAHIMADGLAGMLGGRPDHSGHPTAGQRPSLAPATEVLEREVKPDGDHPSRFRGHDMEEALEWLQRTPFHSNGDGDALVSEFPFGSDTSLLRVDATESNPRVGNGLLTLLTLPMGESAPGDARGAQDALELNRRELQEDTHAHFLGSWCSTEQGLCFVSFFPNAFAAISPGSIVTLVQSCVFRARWVASVFGQTFDPRRGDAGREETMERLWDLSEEEIGQLVARLPPGQDPQRALQALLAMKRAMEQAGDED
jgi:hypothetical protein